MQLPVEYQVTCAEKSEEAKWARSQQKRQQFVQHVSAAPAVRSSRSAFGNHALYQQLEPGLKGLG